MNQNVLIALIFGLIAISLILFLVLAEKKRKVAPTQEQMQNISQSQIPQNRETWFKDRLVKSQSGLSASFKQLFSSSDISNKAWAEFEDQLILADLGANAAANLIHKLQNAIKGINSKDLLQLKNAVKAELIELVDRGFDRTLKTNQKNNQPAVILIVGVNGSGKTTTVAKLAQLLTGKGQRVLLAAADTFRAAAAEQLVTWGQRINAQVIRGAEGSDPASVAFEAIQEGIRKEVDVVLIDTAGRLHTKQNLMDELGKVHRVATKASQVDEILLVIDATTGQNGLNQAKVFSQVVPVTGIVLSKLDGTAKGGIVIGVQEALGVPVKLVGLGEGQDDLEPFNSVAFVEGLIN